ncbi:Amino Acid-Polyamine-Organocation (APC) Family [Phytophthora cinnamomi]|uniref:Amino Acid-Polyamine-Organocation (APC) Family n=1 Tax=Phytophthora cinnamomi TaxID=4785 RepID=UPI00355A0FE9|nr:Amino Acid-Polyamine-Organocation (APC) Family [Phytophthora cinnamomi]
MHHGAPGRLPQAPFATIGDADGLSHSATEFQRLQTPRTVPLDTNLEPGDDTRGGDEIQWASEDGDSMLSRLQRQVARSNSGVTSFRPPKGRILSTAMLLALSFFTVGSGPEGGESVVVAAGPLVGLVALVVFPVVYFVPMGFMVAELVSAIPEAGGHAYWVALAFGPAWGLQSGFWAWVGNCMHCAAYASMGVSSIYQAAGWKDMPVLEYTLRAGMSMLLAMPSFFHLRVVSYAAGTLLAFVLLPYLLIAVWSGVKAESWERLAEIPNSVLKSKDTNLGYGNLVTALVWIFNGFQNLSVFAKCVHDPSRTFRRVMLISLGLIPLSYLVPILPVIALSDTDWATWTGWGSAAYIAAKHLGGSMYTLWITVVALICEAGLYIGGLLCSVYLACGMAEKNFAPFSLRFSGMARPNVYGIDHSVLFCSLAIILIVVTTTIKEMIMISNALSGLETMVLVAAAVRLRVTMPDLPRATYLCGSHLLAMTSALVVPFIASGFVVAWAFTELIPAALTGVFLFSGIIYGLQTDLKDFRYTYEPVRTIEIA